MESIKDLAPIAAPFIPLAVDIFIKPKLEKLHRFLEKNKHQSTLSVAAKFEEYLKRSYVRHSHIPILVFQNQQRRVDDIYIPLTVQPVQAGSQTRTFLIDAYKNEFLPNYQKVLIRDTAGMGKSTLLKKLFLSCLELHKGVPVFIELRKLKKGDSIINFILRELNPINDELDENLVLDLIQRGDFIFFLDGYDEISESDREAVTIEINNFVSKASNNLFIMTSRPEPSLGSFPNFMEFEIRPLMPEEAYELLHKYDPSDKIASEIVEKLESRLISGVGEFLTNPLLVSLLFKSYDYKRTIPLKKHIFYRQVYDALFESHDLTKDAWKTRDKLSRLDSDAFFAVLRALGIVTLKHGIEYSKDEILSLIRRAKELCYPLEFRVADFLNDLLKTVPLFTLDGNYYRWSHKSLQDYFASQYIWLDVKERKAEFLRRLIENESIDSDNLLDLYADVDPKMFRQVIIFDLIKDLLDQFEKSPLSKGMAQLSDPELQMLHTLGYTGSYFLFPTLMSIEIGLGRDGFVDDKRLDKYLVENGFGDTSNLHNLSRFRFRDGANAVLFFNKRQAIRQILWRQKFLLEELPYDMDPDFITEHELKSFFALTSNELVMSDPFNVVIPWLIAVAPFPTRRATYFSIEKCRTYLEELINEKDQTKELDLIDELL